MERWRQNRERTRKREVFEAGKMPPQREWVQRKQAGKDKTKLTLSAPC